MEHILHNKSNILAVTNGITIAEKVLFQGKILILSLVRINTTHIFSTHCIVLNVKRNA